MRRVLGTKSRMLALFACLMVVFAANVQAQTAAGQISGIVLDPSGAVIPGAKVVIKNEGTGVNYETTTTSAGTYVVGALPPGEYTVTVSTPGFQTSVSTKNVLTIGGNLVVNVTMKIGQTAETVQVEASYERLDTTSAMLSGVVDRKQIVELPLNGRNPLNLIIFEPGLVQRSTGSAGSGTHVFGSRDRAHNVTIDGIDANESSVPNPQSNIYRLTPDNVQEYRVVTHNATPEFGRNSGANVAIATRQGTNEFHGDAFYFHRNTVLNSQEFFAKADALSRGEEPEKPVLLLHQFGGDIGGPIIKDRTFFFFSFQGNRIKQSQPISQSFGIPRVFTNSARSGIFRYVRGTITLPDGTMISQNDRRLVDSAGNLVSGVNTCDGVTITTNCVAAFDIFGSAPAGLQPDPLVLPFILTLPLPNSFGTVGDGLNIGGFTWNPPSRFKGPFFQIRGDHKFNDNHNIFARMLWSEYNTTEGDLLNARPALFPGFNPLGGVNRATQNLAISYRAVLSPRMVNEFTTGYSRFNFFFALAEANLAGGLDPVPFAQECFGTDSFSLIDTPICNTPHTQRAVSTVQFIDNFSYTQGAHIWKAGFNFRFYRHNDSRGVPGGFNMAPTIVFSRSVRDPTTRPNAPSTTCPSPCTFTGASAIPSTSVMNSTDRNNLKQAIVELMGIPARIQQVFQGNLAADAYEVALFTAGTRIRHFDSYIQDEWKMRRNLTLTYGLRWEWKQPAKDCCDRTFVPDRDVLGSQGLVTYTAADSWWGRDNANTFAPRVSLAWDPWSNGRTVVRAGWGMAFDTISSFQVTSIAGKVPGSTLQCFTTVPFGSSPAAPPSGCADLSTAGLVTNPQVSDLFAALGSGAAFSQPLPLATPSMQFSPIPDISNNTPGVGAFDPNLKVPTVHEWSLTIQRELGWGFAAQIGYIGKRGIRLYRAYDINQIRTDQPGFLNDFLIAQQNIFSGCTADGFGCGTTPTLLYQLAGCTIGSACSTLNGRDTDFLRNGLGALASFLDANQTASTGFFRPNSQFRDIFYFDSGGSSSYHAMILQVNRRFQQGLTMNFSYTLGKSIDDMSVDPVAASSGGGLSTTNSRTPTDVRDFSLDRSVSDFDNRHVVAMNVLYELPFGKGRRWGSTAPAWVDHVVGGWTVTSIYTYQSGEPFTLNSGILGVHNTKVTRVDVRGTFIQPGLFSIPSVDGPVVYNVGPLETNSASPNFNCREVLTPNGDPTQTQFCIPAPGSFGNTGRNAVRGPNFWNVDIGILKNFNVTERVKFQFRAEMFNAFNHANFANPRNASDGSPTLTSSLFGQTCCVTDSVPSSTTVIANGEPNRVIQFGFKISF